MLYLGELERVFIFGGPYSNLQSTDEVLRIAKKKGFKENQIICTGDTVAYCGEPNETIQRLRESGIYIIKGNVEESLVNDKDECGCNFNEGSVCDTLSAQWYGYLKKTIEIENIKWMSKLPDYINFKWRGFSFTVVHGSYTKISKFIYQSTDSNIKLEQIAFTESDAIIGGHCGLPFGEKLEGNHYWLNPGVIGLPPNDGSQRGCYGILDQDFSVKTFTYDIQKTIDAMKGKMPTEYMDSLRSGIWPSQDILPQNEQKQRGICLKNFRVQL